MMAAARRRSRPAIIYNGGMNNLRYFTDYAYGALRFMSGWLFACQGAGKFAAGRD
jgi:hypothetical protein